MDYLYRNLPMFQRQGAAAMKKDLTNIRLLLEAMGNPHKQFKSIHVGGTNGKGSASHMLSAMFQSQGYRVGVYTSPHYKDFRERIKINSAEKVQSPKPQNPKISEFLFGLSNYLKNGIHHF